MTEEEKNTQEAEEQKRVEFKFPLLILRTKKFGVVFDRLGKLRFSKWISWVILAFVPVVAAFGLFMFFTSFVALIQNPAVGDVARELGPGAYILLPGVNPVLPIFYGWLAIVCAIAIHEGAHGIIARNAGLDVKSSGLMFFLIIPIGAFVDVDEEQIKKAKPIASLRIMAGGVGGNIFVAIVCILGVIVLVNGLTPIVDGVYIYTVNDGSPAEMAGLMAQDVFVSIDDIPINTYNNLSTILDGKSPGDLVQVTVLRGENWNNQFSTIVNLTESDGRAIMGINVASANTEAALDNYRDVRPVSLFLYLVPPLMNPNLVPFSDTLAPFYSHPLGPQWQIWANTLFWLWFVNFNVGIFNALPIYPLDGGRMFHISLKSIGKKRLSDKNVSLITGIVTVTIIAVLLAVIVIPFVT